MMDETAQVSFYPPELNLGDLPWSFSLTEWAEHCNCLEDAPRGVSRHPVVFINREGGLYALKELPGATARQEYEMLLRAEELRLPAVSPVGYVMVEKPLGKASILITRFLEGALPYRLLLSRQGFAPYRRHLLDAIASLMVQIHLTGFFWGDCSLSNTLFRRDAGALRAYLVDAETGEYHAGVTPPTLRFHDLQIMEENINAELIELFHSGVPITAATGVPVSDTGAYIRLRYQELWEEVTREDVLGPDEYYRIQERIRALNRLGFSVGDVELAPSGVGRQLFMRVMVTDRNFHRDALYSLTGLDAEEQQAQKMMNEIQEVRATLASIHNRNTPLVVAAQHWLENIYRPVVSRLRALVSHELTEAELYCQVLEHKWYLSERAQRDVGHQAAVEDYLKQAWVQQRMDL
jgi:hypothetical protein